MNNPLSVEKLENKVRYKGVTVIPVGTDTLPFMVHIIKAPAKIKLIQGKKFINPTKAQIAIDIALAETMIGNGAKSVKKELNSIGFLVED